MSSNKPSEASSELGSAVTAAYSAPDGQGKFGEFGGRYVAETLMHALDELSDLYTLSLIHISEPTRPY